MDSRRSVRLRKPDEQLLGVEMGRVACPSRGDVDIELCFSCPRFRGLQEGTSEDLVCAYRYSPSIPDFG